MSEEKSLHQQLVEMREADLAYKRQREESPSGLMKINWKPEKGLSGGWKIKPLEDPSTHLQYVRHMTKELKKLRGDYKRPVSTIQAQSTMNLITMTPEEAEKYRNRPLPTMAQARANPDAEAIFKEHKGGVQAILVEEDIRRKGRNAQGDAISLGASSVTEESKERGRQAYMFTPPAPILEAQAMKLIEMEKITEYKGPPPAIEKKLSLTERILNFIQGQAEFEKGELTSLRWQDYLEQINQPKEKK